MKTAHGRLRRLVALAACGAPLTVAALAGCGMPVTSTVAPDTTPPARAVMDRDTLRTTSSSVFLFWTAVGDDGSTGTASRYELRYRTGAPLTAATFDNGTPVARLRSPLPAGAAETLTVAGLDPGATHTFLLKVFDDAGNTSLSNSVLVHTHR
jgi:hypothetical protein